MFPGSAKGAQSPRARPAAGLLRLACVAALESVYSSFAVAAVTDHPRKRGRLSQALDAGSPNSASVGHSQDGGRKLQGRVHFGCVVCPEPDPPAFLLEGAHDSTGPSFTSGRMVAGPGVRPRASLVTTLLILGQNVAGVGL